MGEFRVVPNIEFSDAYEQAKADALKARESIRKLTEDQCCQLVNELFIKFLLKHLCACMAAYKLFIYNNLVN